MKKQNQMKCNWCGGNIVEGEECGSSVGRVHFDCAAEVQMDDRASENSYEDRGGYDSDRW